MHAALAELHRQLNSAGQPCDPTDCEREDWERLVADTLSKVINLPDADGTLQSAMDHVDHRLIARWVERYLEQCAEYKKNSSEFDQPLVPAHFEVAFGPVSDDGEQVDSISTAEAYELECNGLKIRLAGRIDRVDIGLIQGQVVFNVLDYKSTVSNYGNMKDIAELRALQLPLYALVIQDFILSERRAIPWQAGYWNVRQEGFKPKQSLAFCERTDEGLRNTEMWDELRERLRDHIGRLVTGIRQGEFPMHCENEQCTSRCPYNTVCRVSAVRSLEKTWQPPAINLK
jgi:ATP-dependent helicase/DNAse subunit B